MTRELSSPRATGFREVSEHLLGEGLAVRFRAGGTSMEPAIGDGDLITVARVRVADLQPGDVVFYASGARTIAHRVVDIRRDDAAATPIFIVRGDAREECDPPVVAGQIIGKVVAVERAPRPRFWKRLLVFIAGRGRRPEPVRCAPQNPPRV